MRDSELLGDFFVDVVTGMSKNGTVYELNIKSGSVDIILNIFSDIIKNPAGTLWILISNNNSPYMTNMYTTPASNHRKICKV